MNILLSFVASYSMVAYQHGTANAAYVAVERDFDSVLAFMREHGYASESWQELQRETFYHHIAPIDQEPLWCDGYGVVRSRNVEALGKLFYEDIVDLSNHPF